MGDAYSELDEGQRGGDVTVVGNRTSPFVIGYAVVLTILAVAAVVLLGVVYFNDDDDNDSNSATVTPLTEFVWRDDPAYNVDWDFDPVKGEGYTLYNINLTSGTWLTPTDSSTFVYYHWLQFCVPDELEDPSFAFLWITGGSNDPDSIPTSTSSEVISMCLGSKTLSFALRQVPNQGMTFQGDPTQQNRKEDAIIAWTWAHFINNTLEPDWLARMPMTRAGIRAMDAGQAFWETIRSEDQKPIDRFVVGGASKRGWTSWMVGSMNDPRVVGIMPVVAPIANITPQMDEQYRSLGFWSWVLYDYYSLNLMGWLFTDVFQEMTQIIDPLYYQPEMAKIKKFQIGGTNDEFFQPDALKWYWDGIPGDKLYRIVAGANHGLQVPGENSEEQVFAAAATFLLSFKEGFDVTLPTYSWEISEDGQTLTVYCSTAGLVEDEIVVWVSKDKTERDWRAFTCPDTSSSDCINDDAKWEKAAATKEKTGKYTYTIDTPGENLYSAFFIELSYDLVEGYSHFLVSTDVSIVPVGQFSYAPCAVCDCGWDCPPQQQPDSRHLVERGIDYDDNKVFA
uniref:Uncharacterized protein n=1 Tax=Paramoeba aestuarina TaxID=180227 RepID=A0A7S4NLN3_9EUKA